jgi:glyoxylase-like metal-dependent hydrolase (beta-lactamase superfamily II)
MQTGEMLDGLWRFEQAHPDWHGQETWDRDVAWWAVRTPAGLVLLDPLPGDWDALDALVAAEGGCAGVIRSTYWHQRDVAATAHRYGAAVWAHPAVAGARPEHYDREVADGDELPGGITAHYTTRLDEIALWIPGHRALAFGDVVLRRADGTLRLCPDSWLDDDGGPQRLREALAPLIELPAEHVLVSHGPFVAGGGAAALAEATLRRPWPTSSPSAPSTTASTAPAGSSPSRPRPTT